MYSNNLAIIIPAFKTEFLDRVFKSINNQTCKKFNLYVFDDASPFNIKLLYERYFASWDNACYKRFERNVGGKDLAKQWMRCVISSGTEDWVWLFSDDDIMSMDCVEQIVNSLENSKNRIEDVLHFNLCQIDDKDIVTKTMNPYPQNITAAEYFTLLHTGKIDTRMPEFVFRRKKLLEIGGFISFDLGWRSDNATVTAMTYPNTIFTLPHGKVLWRLSTKNVTGSNLDQKGIDRKRRAEIDYLNWNYHFFKERNASDGMTKGLRYKTYFCYSRPRWVYNMRFDDVLELMHDFDAINTPLDAIYLIYLWFVENLKMTKKRLWFNRIWKLLSERSTNITYV